MLEVRGGCGVDEEAAARQVTHPAFSLGWRRLGAARCASPKLTVRFGRGVRRAQCGIHQFASPSSLIVAGSSSARSSVTRARLPVPSAAMPPFLIEFPADDAERAQRFWQGLLQTTLASREPEQGRGWQI